MVLGGVAVSYERGNPIHRCSPSRSWRAAQGNCVSKFIHVHIDCIHIDSFTEEGKEPGYVVGQLRFQNEDPKCAAHAVLTPEERFVFYYRITSAAPCISRRMCCPTYCASPVSAARSSIFRMDSISTSYITACTFSVQRCSLPLHFRAKRERLFFLRSFT